MSNTTAPVPVAPSIAAVDLWLQIIPASSVPMAFASLAALIASALFGRWLSVLTPKRAAEGEILRLLHASAGKYDDETHFFIESMLEENKHYFHQMVYIRWALVGASLSIVSSFLAAFLNGVAVFQTLGTTASVPLSDASRAFTIIGAFCLAAGIILTCVELSEVLSPKIRLDKRRKTASRSDADESSETSEQVPLKTVKQPIEVSKLTSDSEEASSDEKSSQVSSDSESS